MNPAKVRFLAFISVGSCVTLLAVLQSPWLGSAVGFALGVASWLLYVNGTFEDGER